MREQDPRGASQNRGNEQLAQLGLKLDDKAARVIVRHLDQLTSHTFENMDPQELSAQINAVQSVLYCARLLHNLNFSYLSLDLLKISAAYAEKTLRADTEQDSGESSYAAINLIENYMAQPITSFALEAGEVDLFMHWARRSKNDSHLITLITKVLHDRSIALEDCRRLEIAKELHDLLVNSDEIENSTAMICDHLIANDRSTNSDITYALKLAVMFREAAPWMGYMIIPGLLALGKSAEVENLLRTIDPTTDLASAVYSAGYISQLFEEWNSSGSDKLLLADLLLQQVSEKLLKHSPDDFGSASAGRLIAEAIVNCAEKRQGSTVDSYTDINSQAQAALNRAEIQSRRFLPSYYEQSDFILKKAVISINSGDYSKAATLIADWTKLRVNAAHERIPASDLRKLDEMATATINRITDTQLRRGQSKPDAASTSTQSTASDKENLRAFSQLKAWIKSVISKLEGDLPTEHFDMILPNLIRPAMLVLPTNETARLIDLVSAEARDELTDSIVDGQLKLVEMDRFREAFRILELIEKKDICVDVLCKLALNSSPKLRVKLNDNQEFRESFESVVEHFRNSEYSSNSESNASIGKFISLSAFLGKRRRSEFSECFLKGATQIAQRYMHSTEALDARTGTILASLSRHVRAMGNSHSALGFQQQTHRSHENYSEADMALEHALLGRNNQAASLLREIFERELVDLENSSLPPIESEFEPESKWSTEENDEEELHEDKSIERERVVEEAITELLIGRFRAQDYHEALSEMDSFADLSQQFRAIENLLRYSINGYL